MRTFGCYCTRSANDAFNKFTDKLIFTSLAITLDNKSKTVPDKSCHKILNPYLMNLLKLLAIYVIKKLKILHVNDFTDTEFWHLITVRFNLTVFGASLYRILYFARLFPCTVYKVSERPSKVTILFLIHSNAIQSMLENEGRKVKQSKMYFK